MAEVHPHRVDMDHRKSHSKKKTASCITPTSLSTLNIQRKYATTTLTVRQEPEGSSAKKKSGKKSLVTNINLQSGTAKKSSSNVNVSGSLTTQATQKGLTKVSQPRPTFAGMASGKLKKSGLRDKPQTNKSSTGANKHNKQLKTSSDEGSDFDDDDDALEIKLVTADSDNESMDVDLSPSRESSLIEKKTSSNVDKRDKSSSKSKTKDISKVTKPVNKIDDKASRKKKPMNVSRSKIPTVNNEYNLHNLLFHSFLQQN